MKTASTIGMLGGTLALIVGAAGLVSGQSPTTALAGLRDLAGLGLPLLGLAGAMLARAHPHRAAALMGGSAACLTRIFMPMPLPMAAIALLGLGAVLALADTHPRRKTA